MELQVNTLTFLLSLTVCVCLCLCLSALLIRSAFFLHSCIGECDSVSTPGRQLCLLNHGSDTHTHTHTSTFIAPPPLSSFFPWQESRKTKLDRHQGLRLPHILPTLEHAASKRRERMPAAVARSDDIVHEPWAEGLAEHAPSTAT